MVLVYVHLQGESHLVQVVFAGSGAGLSLRHGERRKEQGSQNANDGDDHEEFDQSETPSMRWA
jgi:hypothetical protein